MLEAALATALPALPAADGFAAEPPDGASCDTIHSCDRLSLGCCAGGEPAATANITPLPPPPAIITTEVASCGTQFPPVSHDRTSRSSSVSSFFGKPFV